MLVIVELYLDAGFVFNKTTIDLDPDLNQIPVIKEPVFENEQLTIIICAKIIIIIIIRHIFYYMKCSKNNVKGFPVLGHILQLI